LGLNQKALNERLNILASFTGGCFCGAVRYEFNEDPVMVRNCHCDSCRKVTGAAFATNVFVKEEDLTMLQGELTTFDHVADSGNARAQEFCAKCGTSVFSLGARTKGMKAIRIGTIDDASGLEPMANVYTARALSFSYIDETLENSDEMPG
jgi:hypothetical protein